MTAASCGRHRCCTVTSFFWIPFWHYVILALLSSVQKTLREFRQQPQPAGGEDASSRRCRGCNRPGSRYARCPLLPGTDLGACPVLERHDQGHWGWSEQCTALFLSWG